MHGLGEEAKHFEQMQEDGVQPNDITSFVFCHPGAMQVW
jgi:hypothetical protein